MLSSYLVGYFCMAASRSKLAGSLFRMSFDMSMSFLSESPLCAVVLPKVNSIESNSSFVACKSLEMSAFSLRPNTSGC